MGALVYQWIDLVWLPVSWFAVAQVHRFLAAGYFAACALTARMQVELMQSFGADDGFLAVMDSDLWARALAVYGVIGALYLLLAHYSHSTNRIVFLAASITIYVFALSVSSVVMIL